MKAFRNLDELNSYLVSQINSSLIDVGEETKKTMQKRVDTDVYESYTPTTYKRTGKLKDDIEVSLSNNTVSISPTRSENEKYIPRIIETGEGYDWINSRIYKSKQKRPFVQNTKEEIIDKKLHIKTLKSSLKQKKIFVE
ncbi:hypothetical protein EEL31_09355 [Brevibacillus laterosporus]|nr:hypothetical protein [Brevibacillus laterosporus]TPG68711.1 hypothetical protein EEL31_09355 [Brevibacillus laterosporus]